MKASVSIVLCTYNGAKYLSEQLESILAQTYPLHEIIIQDDNSTDETVNIIHEYACKYSLIKFFKNNSAHGVMVISFLLYNEPQAIILQFLTKMIFGKQTK